MELIWATEDLVIAGRPYPGFPILLWDSMESCVPVNDFLRHYLLRGTVGSTKSWPNTGFALYDFFSFLQANDIDWKYADRREGKSIVAVYRDYCLVDCKLARTTTRQRLHYICKFYEYAQTQKWVSGLPFSYEERTVKREVGFLAHVDASGGKVMANDLMPRVHRTLPKFLSSDEVRALRQAAENPHHRMMLNFGLNTGLRREEIATFPLAYIINPNKTDETEKTDRRKPNIRISLNPFDGHGMLTKGSKPRDIYVSHRFLSDLHHYVVHVRGERSSLSSIKSEPLFLNQFGEPFANDGKGIERIVRNIGKKVGIQVHPHMLRHTYATHTLVTMQRNRGDIDPLVFVQRQLGHSSIQTTMVYLHLINELADSAVLAYDDELNDSLETV